MQNDDQFITDQAEFDRLFLAGRGTLRIERGESYVALAHCVTTEENRIRSTRWFVLIYCNDRFVSRAEFDALFTFAAFDRFVAEVINIHGGK